MEKKGEIISDMPMKNDKIDWLLTKGKEIDIKIYKGKTRTFKVLNAYRDGKLTKLSLSENDKYIGNIDCRYIKNGNMDWPIKNIQKGKYTQAYDFDENRIKNS